MRRLVPKAAARSPKGAGKGKGKGKSGGTVEQERRRLGDAVKSRISFEKWTIAATTHVTVDLSLSTFTALIAANAARVTPASYSAASDVVVARITDAAAAGEAFGRSKITGGSRMGKWSVNGCDVVFYPASSKADIWWTMQ